jgi:hypothetical protein
MTYDSDEDMTISESEDVDSLGRDKPEKESTATEGSEDGPAPPINVVGLDEAASGQIFDESRTNEDAAPVKTEVGSAAAGGLRDGIANRRKRPRSEYGDVGNPRAKRPGKHAGNEIEILDLTEVNSD